MGNSSKSGVAVKSAVGWPVNEADFCPSCRQIPLMAWVENLQSRAFLSHTLQSFPWSSVRHYGPQWPTQVQLCDTEIWVLVWPLQLFLYGSAKPWSSFSAFAHHLSRLSLHLHILNLINFVISDVSQKRINCLLQQEGNTKQLHLQITLLHDLHFCEKAFFF